MVLTNDEWLWYKNAGKAHGYRPSGFMSQLGGSWWYDWQHDYTWGDYGNFAYKHFVPMVWCADLPGEPGVPLAPPGDSDKGKGHWNPQELAARVAQNRGRIWLIFNEPDFPPAIHPDTPTIYSYQQCGKVLCEIANYATLPAPVVLPPNVAPTPTQTWTPTPIPPPGATATATPSPVWPCSWSTATVYPVYYDQLRAKMIRMAADRYAQIYRIIKANDPTARVFCCGNLHAGYTTWLADFLQQLRLYHSDVKIDGLAIHAYPWNTSVQDCWNLPLESIWTCMARELEKNRNAFRTIGAPLVPDAPLWITETGYLGIPTVVSPPLTMQQVQQYVMDPMIVWLQSGSTGYQAVAWFISIDADSSSFNHSVRSDPRRSTRRRL
ncbi:MAG: glycosyl hydrolase [Anaerolineae bacterium]